MTYHGIALNVDPDLSDFDLIDPCGMPGVVSTSIVREAGLASTASGRGSSSDARLGISPVDLDPTLADAWNPDPF